MFDEEVSGLVWHSNAAQQKALLRWQRAVTAIFATSGLALATWLSRIPAVRDDLGASTSLVSVLLLGVAIGSIGGLTAAPRIVSAWGTRRGLLVMFLVLAAALSLAGVATSRGGSLAAGCVTLVVFGFANASCDVLMNVEGARVEEAMARTRLPLTHGFFSIGTIVGALGGAVSSRIALPVFVHFGLIALVILIGGLWAVGRLPQADTEPVTVHGPATGETNPTAHIWFSLQLIVVGVLLAGMAFAEGAGNDWISLGSVDGHHFTNTAGAVAFGAFVAAMTVGRLTGGVVLDRFGRARVLATLAVVGIAGTTMTILGDSSAVIIAGTALWGLGISLGFPATVSAAADHPTHAARRVSVVSIFGYAMFLISPPVIGFIGQHCGILKALWLVVAALGIALTCTPVLRRPRHAAWRPAGGDGET